MIHVLPTSAQALIYPFEGLMVEIHIFVAICSDRKVHDLLTKYSFTHSPNISHERHDKQASRARYMKQERFDYHPALVRYPLTFHNKGKSLAHHPPHEILLHLDGPRCCGF